MRSDLNDLNEHELLSDDERNVSRLVGGLQAVDAPVNFERRVMSKIAERKSGHRSYFRVPVVAYALSLAFVLVLAGYVVLRFRQPETRQPVVSSLTTPQAAPTAPPDRNNVSPAPDEVVAADPVEPSAPVELGSPTRASVKTASRRTKSDRGGTVTFGQGQAKQVMPEGMEPDRPRIIGDQTVVTPAAPISVGQILDPLGIVVEFDNGWRVTAVRPQTVAARSGVRVGDTLISLGDRELKQETTFSNSGSFRTITVRRDDKVMPLKLQ
jgi:hypothetical protein